MKRFKFVFIFLLCFTLASTPKSGADAEYISFTGTGKDEIQKDAYMSLVVMGVVAWAIWEMKPTCVGWPGDVKAAAAAATAYLFGEVKSWMDYKKLNMDFDKKQYDKDPKQVTNEQRTSLEEQKKQYEAIKKIAKSKLSLQQASAVGWAFAATLALYKHSKIKKARKVCEEALASEQSNAEKQAEDSSSDSNAVFCKGATEGASQESATLMGEMDKKEEIPLASVKKTSEKNDDIAKFYVIVDKLIMCGDTSEKIKTACKPWTEMEVKSLMKCKLKKTSYNNSSDPVGFLNELLVGSLNLLFPKTFAGNNSMLSMLGFAAVGATLVGVIKKKTKNTTDLYMSSPKTRGYVWLGLAGISTIASSNTKKVITQMDENIKELDEILKNVEKSSGEDESTGEGTSKTSSGTDTPSSETQTKTGTVSSEANLSTQTAISDEKNNSTEEGTELSSLEEVSTKDGQSATYSKIESEIDTTAVALAAVNSTAGKTTMMALASTLPDDLGTTSSAIAKVLGSTNNATIDVSTSELGKKGAFIKKAQEKIIKVINNDRGLEGKKKINFSKQIGRYVARIKKETQAALKSENAEISDLAKKMGFNGFISEKKEKKKKYANKGIFPDYKFTKSKSGFDFDDEEIFPEKVVTEEETVSIEAELERNAGLFTKASINKSKKLLFEIISERYFKTAYPILGGKKKKK